MSPCICKSAPAPAGADWGRDTRDGGCHHTALLPNNVPLTYQHPADTACPHFPLTDTDPAVRTLLADALAALERSEKSWSQMRALKDFWLGRARHHGRWALGWFLWAAGNGVVVWALAAGWLK